MLTYFLIALGSALGGMGRHWCSGLVARTFGEMYPWGTVLVNVSGSLAIGFLATLLTPEGRVFIPPDGRAFLLIGFCGGYTTFSTFSLQTLNLLRDGEWAIAGLNIFLSLVLCLIAVWLGNLGASALAR